eukprot:290380-Rhodomonas_salina.1
MRCTRQPVLRASGRGPHASQPHRPSHSSEPAASGQPAHFPGLVAPTPGTLSGYPTAGWSRRADRPPLSRPSASPSPSRTAPPSTAGSRRFPRRRSAAFPTARARGIAPASSSWRGPLHRKMPAALPDTP